METHLTRKWRTLVRIVRVEHGTVFLVLPSWNFREVLEIKASLVPDEYLLEFKPDFRCHAYVNTGTDVKEDLVFSDWEE